jgi:hypothetical protein
MAACAASASCAELLGIEEATVDASIDTSIDATDSNVDDVLTEGIRCGTLFCEPGAQACCVGSGHCQSLEAGTAGNCVAVLRCDEQAECEDGAVCCLTTMDAAVLGDAATSRNSQCVSSCDNGMIMCNPDAAGPDCTCTGTVTVFGVSYSTCEQ